MKHRIIAAMLAASLLMCSATVVIAADGDNAPSARATGTETVNDLFALYGENTRVTLEEAERELNYAKDKYAEAIKIVRNAESFNNAREEAIKVQEMQKQDILSQIDSLTSKNDNISVQIADNINGDFELLSKLDAEYKVNLDNINRLYKKIDGYKITDEVIIPDIDTDGVEAEVVEKEEQFTQAIDAATLGDVRNVRHPLNNEYRITSQFGTRINPVTKKGSQFHSGLDMRASSSTEVLSIFNGKVVGADYDNYLGNYVRIDHGNGVVSLYGHLTSSSVSVGQAVTQYDVIALSGNTGSMTTGPHLHFGLFINGLPVDPEILLGG